MGLSAGTKLGPYDVRALLGAGGMGEVWRARDTRLGREVALKVLPEEFTGNWERVMRFQREAQLLAALNHPHIASIYSFETVDTVRVLVMELVPGETIREMLHKGPLPLSRVLLFAHDVAEALGAAHAKGILHRDLKPSNVKVTPDEEVKLLDFGLAKAFAPVRPALDEPESVTLEASASLKGEILGTAPYMSPEQARGLDLDTRSDVWAFGCLVYEMLSGKKAFDGATAYDVLVAIIDREPDWNALPPATPRPLVDLLKRCLAKRVGERLPDLVCAREQIDLVRTGQALPAPAAAGASPRIRRRPLSFAAGGVALLAVAVAVTWISLREGSGQALPSTKLLAVLPAADFTGQPNGPLRAAGISASLRGKLQRAAGVQIMFASDAPAARETNPVKVARDTGANLILQPTVRQVGDRVQLSFSLALASSPVQIDAGEVTGPESDLFDLENELAKRICSSLELRDSGGPARPSEEIAKGPSQGDYFTALGCLERYDDPAQVQRALRLLAEIPNGGTSALVQAALGKASLAAYDLSKDVALAARAKDAAERALSLDPNLPEAQVILGQILTATGDYGNAAEVIGRAVEKKPGDAEAVRALALALNKAGRLAEAEKAFLRVAELKPRTWSAYSGLGYFYFSSHQYQKAADAYQKGISLNPDVGRLHYNLGAALLRLRRYPQAERAFSRSIEIKPQAIALSNLGTLLYLQGRFQDAVPVFRKAIALEPNDPWSHKSLADALSHLPVGRAESLSEYAAAARLAKEMLRVNPRDGEAYAIMASHSARKKKGAGLREIQKALELEPRNPVVLQSAGLIFHGAGLTAAALSAIERALDNGLSVDEIEAEPDLADLHSNPRYRTIIDKHSDQKEKP